MDYNEKRAELVGMLNLVEEQLKEYELIEFSTNHKEFKELCAKKQRILQKIDILDKETLSI